MKTDRAAGLSSPIISHSPTPMIQLNGSPRRFQSHVSDNASSLNDDLSIGSRNKDQTRDSLSMRRSSFDSTFNSIASTMHTVKHGLDYSPLVDNSIYEIVMNTRFKRWLRHPTIEDIPAVTLCKNEIKDDWSSDINNYTHEIEEEYKIYERTNNISKLNRFEQVSAVEDSNAQYNIITTKEKVFEEIPGFYFDKDFKLDHPNFFRRIVQDFDLDSGQLLNEDDAMRTECYDELQNKLNFYLDTVENILVSDISKSIHKFFDALEDVDKIKANADDSISEMNSVSSALEDLRTKKILERIHIIEDLIKRKNVEKLQQGLLQVKLIEDKCAECKNVYGDGKLEDSLELISSIESLLKGDNSNPKVNEWTSKWPYKLANLYHLPALQLQKDFLYTLKVEIGGSYSLQLSNLLLEDLQKYASSQTRNETLVKLQTKKDPLKAHLSIDETFRAKLKALITQLIHCNELTEAVKMYEVKFIAELKGIIKTNLPREKEPQVSNNSSLQGSAGGSKLSKLIQNQSSAEFQDMLISIFSNEIEVLRRLTRHQKLLLDIALGEVPTWHEQSDNVIIDLDIRKSINEGIRILQLRMGKIISVRRDITNSLRFDHFVQFYQICLLFMRECESVSGEFLTKYLSDVISVQLDTYLKSLQSLNLRVLRQKIEQEKWTPFIVVPELQRDVNDIVSCTDIDPSNWSKITDLTKPSPLDEIENTDNNNQGHKKSVVLGDKTFVASDTLIVAIKMINTLLILATNLPSQYSRQCERQLTDLLKFFNTKAMESVTSTLTDKPSTKTDKNLSIMAESLDCLAEITLLLQGYFQRVLGSNTERYQTIWKQLQQSSEKLFQSNSLPPPV